VLTAEGRVPRVTGDALRSRAVFRTGENADASSPPGWTVAVRSATERLALFRGAARTQKRTATWLAKAPAYINRKTCLDCVAGTAVMLIAPAKKRRGDFRVPAVTRKSVLNQKLYRTMQYSVPHFLHLFCPGAGRSRGESASRGPAHFSVNPYGSEGSPPRVRFSLKRHSRSSWPAASKRPCRLASEPCRPA